MVTSVNHTAAQQQPRFKIYLNFAQPINCRLRLMTNAPGVRQL
jgi:hypothetical protein